MSRTPAYNIFFSPQVTLAFLEATKREYKPKICISENVVTGNIGTRVVESLESSMQAKAPLIEKIGSRVQPTYGAD